MDKKITAWNTKTKKIQEVRLKENEAHRLDKKTIRSARVWLRLLSDNKKGVSRGWSYNCGIT